MLVFLCSLVYLCVSSLTCCVCVFFWFFLFLLLFPFVLLFLVVVIVVVVVLVVVVLVLVCNAMCERERSVRFSREIPILSFERSVRSLEKDPFVRSRERELLCMQLMRLPHAETAAARYHVMRRT